MLPGFTRGRQMMRKHNPETCRFCRDDGFTEQRRGLIRKFIADALGVACLFVGLWGAMLIGHGLGW